MTIEPGPDAPYLPKLDEIDFQPVFILGLHRSGTTILYQALSATGCFNPVTAYHLIRHDRLLADHAQGQAEAAARALTRQLRQQGVTDRGIDGLCPTAHFEEEYGFLLGNKPSRMRLCPANLDILTTLCRKIQFTAANDKPLLLKNPHDVSNFLYIKKAFPAARFVFIHRHPIDVLSSQARALKSLFTEKNQYVARLHAGYDALFRRPLALAMLRFGSCRAPILGTLVLTRNAARAMRYYLNNIQRLPRDDVTCITYEALCANPQATLERITKSLGLAADSVATRTPRIVPRNTSLEPNIRALGSYIRTTMQNYCSLMGYDVHPNEDGTR